MIVLYASQPKLIIVCINPVPYYTMCRFINVNVYVENS